MSEHIDYDMMNILAALTTRQREYVVNISVRNMGASAAARAAGLTNPPTCKPVREAIRQVHIRNAKNYEVELDDIIRGYQESIDVARAKGEPQSMIAGYRELARITGHLDTDKGPNIGNQLNILQITQEQMQALPFSDLIKLIPKEIQEQVLDGDHPRPESLAALPDTSGPAAPADDGVTAGA